MDDKYISDKSVTDKEIKAILDTLKAEKAKEKKEAQAKARNALRYAAARIRPVSKRNGTDQTSPYAAQQNQAVGFF